MGCFNDSLFRIWRIYEKNTYLWLRVLAFSIEHADILIDSQFVVVKLNLGFSLQSFGIVSDPF